MKSIFDPAENDSLISRIQKLTPESRALWGKMNAAQMFSHCQAPMDVASGKISLKANPIIALLGRLMKNKILNESEFKKNSPTAPAFIRNTPCDFESSQSELIQKIRFLASEGKQSIVIHKHPFFGAMSNEEWDVLMWKHMDHHLRQFGV